MGLFDKLFKNLSEKLTEDDKKALNDFADALNTAAEQKQKEEAEKPAYSEPEAQSSGSSNAVPEEENQYNFNGPYYAYFEKLFNEEFPEYRIERIKPQDRRAYVFTFYEGARKALVVELLNSSSAAKKIRSDCAKEGTPYLRYYYDHEGWWNTRSYVTNRTRQALGK